MRSYDYEMWDVFMDGPYVPMKTKRGSEEMEPKQRSEWTDTEVKKVHINFKAINTITPRPENVDTWQSPHTLEWVS